MILGEPLNQLSEFSSDLQTMFRVLRRQHLWVTGCGQAAVEVEVAPAKPKWVSSADRCCRLREFPCLAVFGWVQLGVPVP